METKAPSITTRLRFTPLTLLAGLGLLAGAVAACQASAATPAGGASSPGRKVSVNGIARLDIVPDECHLTLTLSVREKRPGKAVKELEKKRVELVAKLREAGFTGDRLSLDHVNLNPIHGRLDKSHLIIEYQASVAVVVLLQDFGRLGEVMELAADLGVTRMSTRFQSSKMTEHKRQARQLALKAARDKASSMAGMMSVGLGEVLEIREVQEFNPGRWALDNANGFVPATSGGTGPLLPGAIPLSLTVYVSFAIR